MIDRPTSITTYLPLEYRDQHNSKKMRMSGLYVVSCLMHKTTLSPITG